MKHLIITAALVTICLSAVAQTPRITFMQPMLYPEGVAYNAGNNLIYLSSATTATIGTLDKSGNYKVFYQDTMLKSSFGMKADTKRNCLWVCTGDPNYSLYKDSSTTFKKKIRLISIDLATGKKKTDTDLSNLYTGKHFANDLALSDKGDVYITDSYSPVIYKVTAQGSASVFAESELFKGENIGLNGIVWNPQGFLLVINASTGSLLKVDINDPKKIEKVAVEQFFPAGDGLLWDDQKNLVLIQNSGVNKCFQLASTDNWKSAKVKAATGAADRFQHPSTATIINGEVYALNSKLNELDDPTLPPSKEFSLQLAVFKAL